MKRLFACTLLLIATAPSLAADSNGYSAQYECRAGGPNCNVDVVALGNRSCDQTIAPSTPWSSINWSNNTICLEAGDHTGKGTLNLGASGTAGTYKVLRYYSSNDTNDDPWNQGSNQAKIFSVNANGNDYWILNRLTIDPNNGTTNGIDLPSGSTYNIISRTLLQKTNGRLVEIAGDNNTVQNSVLRTTWTPGPVAQENQCLSVNNASNVHVVNNEIYDCNKAISSPAGSPIPGTVIENNDLYVSPAGRTDCNGNYSSNGTCSVMEAVVSWKSGGSISNISRIIHNRIWGSRYADGNLVQSGDSPAISISARGDGDDGTDYTLVKDNIIFDQEIGIWNYWGGPDHNSVIGNTLWDIKDRNPNFGYEKGALTNWRMTSLELYLNTVIDATPWLTLVNDENNDLRCNVIISAGANNGSGGSGTQLDYNTYYDTASAGEANVFTNGVSTRANSTTYSVGAIIRTGAASSCSVATSTTCFFYKVTVAGTSAGSPPNYTTTLGATNTDGTMTVQAIRGPYSFKRKLKTVSGGETVVIPYARPHTSAPEYAACPGVGNSSRPGTRADIGISDNLL